MIHMQKENTLKILVLKNIKSCKKAVRKSLVLLKNENDVLPISKKAKHIHVAGIGANDIGMQCGGWTMEWQGKMGPITDGTTILEALNHLQVRTQKLHMTLKV